MVAYNLTERQQALLIKLINGIRNENWGHRFIDASSNDGDRLLSLPGNVNVPIEDLSDMDVIASTDLVLKDFTSRGTDRYTITQAAFDAVDNEFIVSEPVSLGVQQNIGVQVQGSVAGSVLGVGFVNESEIQQIINDPEALQAELEKITNELLNVVKDSLNSSQIVDYARLIEELKAEFQNEKADEKNFRKIIGGLSFINDTTSSIELVLKALPYISFVLQLAAQVFVQ